MVLNSSYLDSPQLISRAIGRQLAFVPTLCQDMYHGICGCRNLLHGQKEQREQLSGLKTILVVSELWIDYLRILVSNVFGTFLCLQHYIMLSIRTFVRI